MELPEDLRELERRLGERPVPGPSPELRARVLLAVRLALRAPVRVSRWSFAAAAAAAALAALNLSMSAANDTHLPRSGNACTGDLRSEATRMRELIPELDEREALRQAMLGCARAGVVAAPLVKSPPLTQTSNKE